MICEICKAYLPPTQRRVKLHGKYCCFEESCVYLITKSAKWTLSPTEAKALIDELFDGDAA